MIFVHKTDVSIVMTDYKTDPDAAFNPKALIIILLLAGLLARSPLLVFPYLIVIQ